MRAPALLCTCILFVLSGCTGWPSEPYSYHPATTVPSHTPRVQTATPAILSPTPLTATGTSTTTGTAETPTATQPAASETPATEPSPATAAVKVAILGCDTGLDVLHGMGEVTNAYVTVSNAGPVEVPNLCATLYGLDEGRPHPDKTKCVPVLPAGYQVTFKLTVDTTYKAATPIQVQVATDGTLLVRTGEAACTAIGTLLAGAGDLDAIRAMPTP